MSVYTRFRFIPDVTGVGFVSGRIVVESEPPIVTGSHFECNGNVTISRDEYDALHATRKSVLWADLITATDRYDIAADALRKISGGMVALCAALASASDSGDFGKALGDRVEYARGLMAVIDKAIEECGA